MPNQAQPSECLSMWHIVFHTGSASHIRATVVPVAPCYIWPTPNSSLKVTNLRKISPRHFLKCE